MIAYAIKSHDGYIKKGWILRGGRPNLSFDDHKLLASNNYFLEEISVEEAISNKAPEATDKALTAMKQVVKSGGF